MRILYIFCFILILSYSKPSDAKSHHTQNTKRDLCFNKCRKKREIDGQDVINRFEMERVSPLYDILRHLPPFEDGWLSNPVTSPTFSSESPLRLKNESSSYGEFKIEVKKDEEHVVSESGRQFKENSALNWYYSAESYSSVDNFSNTNTDKSKPPTTTFRSNTNELPYEITSTKSSTLRRQDEEHVVSHVPSLKGGRGAFLDFKLLESSTTPKVDSTLPAKIEEAKPNITTRYILLQSGRIVAINVTSVSSVLKPTSSSGSSNKNPLLPTFYFGSRIRNKNATKASVNNTSPSKQERLTTVKPEKLVSTSHVTSHKPNAVSQVHTVSVQNRAEQPAGKTTTVHFSQTLTIKPNVENSKSLQTSSGHPFTIKPNVEYAKTLVFRNHSENKSQQHQQTTGTTHSQRSKEVSATTKTPSSREINTLDPAQIWWSEMKAAKEKQTSLVTTVKPKTTTVPASSVLKVNALQPSTVTDRFTAKTFDFTKKTENTVTHPTIELTANARSAKLRMTDKNALHFSTTASPPKSSKALAQTKAPRTWTTFTSITVNHNKNINENPVTNFDEDLLEPSVPLSEIRHDFVRIATLPSPAPVTQPVTVKSRVSHTPSTRGTSRKPRYRGLSHVTLQAPKNQQIETSTRPLANPLPQFQLTTVPDRRSANYQQRQNRWTSLSENSHTSPPLVQPPVTPPPKRSRNGFHLRNSVSFQIIPPGSLTDRRTLSKEPEPSTTTVESLQPQLEDLLIISFEPTRKSMSNEEDQTISERNLTNKGKLRNSQPPTKKPNLTPILTKNQLKTDTLTIRPHRRVDEIAFLSEDAVQSRANSGNRVGRNFRNNNSRYQSVTEKITSNPGTTSTTKQPFRVYYFEPKRKKVKHSEETTKDNTSTIAPTSNRKPPRNNSVRSHSSASSGGNKSHQERFRNTEVNHRPHTRQAKQLQISPREESAPAEATTSTEKPNVKRFRSSPFIWHRPNVGTVKTVE